MTFGKYIDEVSCFVGNEATAKDAEVLLNETPNAWLLAVVNALGSVNEIPGGSHHFNRAANAAVMDFQRVE